MSSHMPPSPPSYQRKITMLWASICHLVSLQSNLYTTTAMPTTIATSRIFFPSAQKLVITTTITLTTFATKTYVLANDDISKDNYCGKDWMDAFRNCGQPCPSGEDSECINEGETCQGFTGCAEKVAPGDEEEESPEETTIPSVFPSIWPSVAPTGQPPTSGVFSNSPTWNGGTSGLLVTRAPSSSSVNESSNNLPSFAPTDENDSDRPYLQKVVTASSSTNAMLSTSYNPALGVYSPLAFSSQQAYGVIFDLETTASSPALLVRGMEFYVVVDPPMSPSASDSTRQGGG
ncbi:hypothetical protein ACHAXS_008149, partial [Conticribra weissflogii]